MQRKSYRKPTNPIVASLIESLNTSSYENEAPIWRRVSKLLQRPTRQRATTNLSKINRHVKNTDSAVVVPGKVLAAGDLTQAVTIAAVSFSKAAQEKILSANGKAITIPELAKENPKGSNVRIIV